MSRRATIAGLLSVALAVGSSAALASSTVSFTQMEQQFMCVECHEALNVAQSQESFSERSYLRQLIAQGLGPKQIKAQMVAAYGPAVLSTPPASGFNLTIYVLPPAIVLLGAAALAFALPRWRRRSREVAAESTAHPPPAFDPDDVRRLDEDLARRA